MNQTTVVADAGMGRAQPDEGFDVVTGAFSYSGAAIARELLAAGRHVRTLTGHPDRRGTNSQVEVKPLRFDDPIHLTESLQGATTLYNTYWVRFARGSIDHETAVANSRTLFHAARQAGVERIVHLSITNPDIASPYPYFRGKAQVERILAEIGVSYAVLRPAILFGGDGVLLNNIAWLLRRLPVFAIGGRGDYRIRAIHIDDLAKLAVSKGAERTNAVLDAVGPERPTFRELVDMIRLATRARSAVVHVPQPAIPLLSSILNVIVHDKLITREECHAMTDGLADTDGPPTGATSISQWIAENGQTLGVQYANELKRHYDMTAPG